MQPAAKQTISFFVDESGDPAFYGKGGRIIVGEQGCSRILILGFVQTDNPQPIRDRLAELHQRIDMKVIYRLGDEVLKAVGAP